MLNKITYQIAKNYKIIAWGLRILSFILSVIGLNSLDLEPDCGIIVLILSLLCSIIVGGIFEEYITKKFYSLPNYLRRAR